MTVVVVWQMAPTCTKVGAKEGCAVGRLCAGAGAVGAALNERIGGILGKVISLVITGNGNYQYLPVITTPLFKLLPADLPRRKLPETGGGQRAARSRRRPLFKGWGRIQY